MCFSTYLWSDFFFFFEVAVLNISDRPVAAADAACVRIPLENALRLSGSYFELPCDSFKSKTNSFSGCPDVFDLTHTGNIGPI